MTNKRVVITGPDIDRLAEGIHGPEIAALSAQLKNSKASNTALRKELKQLRKQLKGALNHQRTLQQHLTDSKEQRMKLQIANNSLRAQLLNLGATPKEEP